MTRILAHSDFVTVPLAMAAVAACRFPSRAVDLVAIAAGVLVWTFVEYWLHRALHMRTFPRLRALHMHHHQHPTDPSGGTLYSSAIILALVIVGVVVPAIAPILFGFLAGYLVFIVLHHAEHHGPRLRGPIVGRLARNHVVHHHEGPERMYGVSTSLWDHLFGTA